MDVVDNNADDAEDVNVDSVADDDFDCDQL